MRQRAFVYGTILLLGTALWLGRRSVWRAAVSGAPLARPRSVSDVLAAYGPATRRRFAGICRDEGVKWPPKRVYLLAFKQERKLEVWAGPATSRPYARLATYDVLGASGGLGPKRREGDLQVPEGVYRLPVLNPNSAYHLSVRVDYPNADDLRNAVVPRERMGGDIYIHGNTGSIGCLAMGDPAIEEIFCLVALANPTERRVLIAPVDFRRNPNGVPTPPEPWVRDLYARLRRTLRAFPDRPAPG